MSLSLSNEIKCHCEERRRFLRYARNRLSNLNLIRIYKDIKYGKILHLR
jgi:hypothetical protein